LHPRDVLADMPDMHARDPRENVARVGRMGRHPRSACNATSLPDWLASGLLRCSAGRLSVCRVVLQIPRARHKRLVVDILARMSRGCYEETASIMEFEPYGIFIQGALISSSLANVDVAGLCSNA